jgi:ABC-type amino acid transport substrate-binding protein
MIAYYPLAAYVWKDDPAGDRRLHSPHRKNGTVVQGAPAGQYSSFEAFKQAVRNLPLDTETEPTPQVAFTSLRGDRIEVTYGDRPVLNGTPVDRANWPLFGGPFIQSTDAERTVVLQDGTHRRTLDFDAGTITNSTAS